MEITYTRKGDYLYDEWRYNYPASQAALEQAVRDKRRKDRATNIDE